MPITLHLDARKPSDVALAAALLQQGKLVAFATETVYGLGASAFSAEAVAAVFAAKQRPAWDPLIVHVASVTQIVGVARIPAPLQSRIAQLAAAFWPGPLTLLLPRQASIPDAVTAGRDLVGVRVPRHPVARALLAAAGLPIAAPSANLFGHTSPTTAAHVLADLDGRIDAVLDAGPTDVGLESSVLDPTQTPMILYRPGAVTPTQITEATGVAVISYQPDLDAHPDALRSPAAPESLPSPGVGMRHYAPHAELVLVQPAADALRTLLAPVGIELNAKRRVGLMLPAGWASLENTCAFAWGRWDAPEELGRNLFAGLRSLDDQGVDIILCPLPALTPHTAALHDRLTKAARLPRP